MTRLNRAVKCALFYLRCVGSSTTATVAAVALLLPMSRPTAAAVICQQECASGTCAQASCGKAVAGGFSHCAGGLLSWNDGAYSSWCLAWGQPLPSSGLPGSAVEVGTGALADDAISHSEAMTAAVGAANPWVAALLTALHDARWANGPTRGLLHESYVDATMTAHHSAAFEFTGQATTTATGALQVDIRVTGDVEQMVHLARDAAVSSPSAIPPRDIHGSVTAGGRHGTLLVSATDGRQQTIQW